MIPGWFYRGVSPGRSFELHPEADGGGKRLRGPWRQRLKHHEKHDFHPDFHRPPVVFWPALFNLLVAGGVGWAALSAALPWVVRGLLAVLAIGFLAMGGVLARPDPVWQRKGIWFDGVAVAVMGVVGGFLAWHTLAAQEVSPFPVLTKVLACMLAPVCLYLPAYFQALRLIRFHAGHKPIALAPVAPVAPPPPAAVAANATAGPRTEDWGEGPRVKFLAAGAGPKGLHSFHPPPSRALMWGSRPPPLGLLLVMDSVVAVLLAVWPWLYPGVDAWSPVPGVLFGGLLAVVVVLMAQSGAPLRTTAYWLRVVVLLYQLVLVLHELPAQRFQPGSLALKIAGFLFLVGGFCLWGLIKRIDYDRRQALRQSRVKLLGPSAAQFGEALNIAPGWDQGAATGEGGAPPVTMAQEAKRTGPADAGDPGRRARGAGRREKRG